MFDMNMGINHQVRAVAEFLNRDSGIEASWDDQLKQYRARVEVAPWYNGRERGLVFVVSDAFYKESNRLVIAVFEHRNGDHICTVEWIAELPFNNPPTINDVPENVYKTKHDTTFSVGYGQIREMAEHIREEFEEFCKTW